MYSAGTLCADKAIIDGVLSDFLPLCAIAHPSFRETAIVDYLTAHLTEMGLHPVRDQNQNLMADIPATPGLEHLPLLIFQGHTDMVCAVGAGSGYVPERDPITTIVEQGVLRTDGRSSLGADNNLGNACVLWLLRQKLPHGPLRILLTAAEEAGLVGAEQIPAEWLSGAKYLINTDGFKTGDLVVSSAGGRRELYTRPLHTVLRKKKAAFRLTLSGFQGGHSGYDINKGRGNPLKLMSLFLGELRESVEYELAAFSGGHAHNAIPSSCTATIVIDAVFAPELARCADKLSRSLLALYARKDPGAQIALAEVAPPERVWTEDCRDATLDLLALLYTGVYAMHDTLPEQVSASSNLGVVRVTEDAIQVACFVRCIIGFSEEIIAFQHARAAKFTGFSVSHIGYPGWPGEKEHNPLAQRMAALWEARTGQPANITAVHVGLEPSVLREKNPALIMVSTGPDIINPHSTDEHVLLSTLPAYLRLLADTLGSLAEPQNPDRKRDSPCPSSACRSSFSS